MPPSIPCIPSIPSIPIAVYVYYVSDRRHSRFSSCVSCVSLVAPVSDWRLCRLSSPSVCLVSHPSQIGGRAAVSQIGDIAAYPPLPFCLTVSLSLLPQIEDMVGLEIARTNLRLLSRISLSHCVSCLRLRTWPAWRLPGRTCDSCLLSHCLTVSPASDRGHGWPGDGSDEPATIVSCLTVSPVSD